MRLLASVAVALLITATAAASGGLKADLSVHQQDSASIEFRVDVQSGKPNSAYSLWVANECFHAGELISAEYLPVRYPSNEAKPSEGFAGPFATSGDSCTAYVWEFPGSQTPLAHGDSQISYTP